MMKILFMCGYYSDAAHETAERTSEYGDAYRFCRAVRSGAFEEKFYIHTQKDKILVNENNIDLARRAFGKFIEKRIAEETSWPSPVLVPMPSEDAVIGVNHFRSWFMLNEALAQTELRLSPVDALFWKKTPRPGVLDAAAAERKALAGMMTCDFPLRGQAVVLVDDLVSTGTTLLAARDCLTAEGAAVLGAVTCGRVIHDFHALPFGRQETWLEDGVTNTDA